MISKLFWPDINGLLGDSMPWPSSCHELQSSLLNGKDQQEPIMLQQHWIQHIKLLDWLAGNYNRHKTVLRNHTASDILTTAQGVPVQSLTGTVVYTALMLSKAELAWWHRWRPKLFTRKTNEWSYFYLGSPHNSTVQETVQYYWILITRLLHCCTLYCLCGIWMQRASAVFRRAVSQFTLQRGGTCGQIQSTAWTGDWPAKKVSWLLGNTSKLPQPALLHIAGRNLFERNCSAAVPQSPCLVWMTLLP